MRALSIQQPWAWLIVNRYKDIENRTWSTKFRGPFLVHAGKQIDKWAYDDILANRHPVSGELLDWRIDAQLPDKLEVGGIVGVAEVVDCVEKSPSPWFVGPHGFMIRNARPVQFRPYRGMLGFFTVGDA